MSLGGSSSKSSSQTTKDAFGFNFGEQGSYLDPAQQAAQQQLQGSYFDMLAQSQMANPLMMQQAAPYQNQFARQMFDMGGFTQLNAADPNAPIAMDHWRRNAFGNQAGLQTLGRFSQQNNPYLNQAIGNVGNQIGQQFREQILPGIAGEATMAGQRGSSRQGVAEGIAARGAMQAFGEAATGMQMDAYGQQQAAAGQLAQLGLAGMGQNQDYVNMQRSQQLQGMGLRSQMLGQQQAWQSDIWNQARQNMLSPFQIGAGIIGAPSVLNYGYSGGFNMDQTRSQSSGKGNSLSIGL